MPEGTRKSNEEIKRALIVAESKLNDASREDTPALVGVVAALDWALGTDEDSLEEKVGFLGHIYEKDPAEAPSSV